jgi:UDP-N-acetylglucosamine/UDP-N-acetylgalactosamine diphosphorylase
LPFHLAHKKVPCLDESHVLVEPEAPNAYKFERFIFDVLPHARRALVVEADRTQEFNPVKNSSGVNSPDDVRQSMSQLHADWLRAAGVNVPEGVPVEISPLYAVDAEELTRKVDRHLDCREPLFLKP